MIGDQVLIGSVYEMVMRLRAGFLCKHVKYTQYRDVIDNEALIELYRIIGEQGASKR